MELRMSLETDAVEPLGDFDAFFHATSSGSRGPQRSSRGMPAQDRIWRKRRSHDCWSDGAR